MTINEFLVIKYRGDNMAKRFSENEKKVIQDRLLNIAEICWGKYGIKKTSVDELVQMAGISKGAFYLFYESKELLFLDVLVRIDKRIKDSLLEALKTSKESKKQGFINGIKKMFLEVQKTPWMLNLQNGDYDLLIQKLPEETVKEHLTDDESDISLILKSVDINCDTSFVSSVMKSIFFTQLHKKEIGEEQYEEVTQFFIESLANRIFDRS
ncbi:TetR/AcrR family transcriptional regulator [Paenibacillus turicensis]|nr:TetR/AcrR family transcriptional regulator [Paenibacillus turicensis]